MGEVSLTIAGEQRVLDFTFETFEQIGQQIGSDDFMATMRKIANDLAGDGQDGLNFKTFWIILAEGLREHWPDVTVQTLRKNLRPRDLPQITAAIKTAFERAQPEAEPEPAAGVTPSPEAQAAA